MKYNKISADVLNEADRFERILNWQLFCSQQEAMLWDYAGTSESKWNPGDNLWRHPMFRDFASENALPWDEAQEFGSQMYGGNHIRPMFELLEDGERYAYMACDDCDVSWARSVEKDCWNCGKEYPASMSYGFGLKTGRLFIGDTEITMPLEGVPWRGLTEVADPIGRIERAEVPENGYRLQFHYYAQADMEFSERLWGNLQASLDRFNEGMRGFRAAFSIFDEGIIYPRAVRVSEIRPDPVNPFKVEERKIELPRAAVAEFIPESEWRFRFRLPSRRRLEERVQLQPYDRYGRVVPTPPRMADLNIDYSQYSYRPSWVEMMREGRR